MSEFAAITCYFNPCAYENRRVGYERFAVGLENQNVPLWTIEAALSGQPFVIPDNGRVLYVRLPEDGWLWQKERMLNLLLRQLPTSITKVAWVDCDLLFHNDQWGQLAIDALNTWPVVQLFDYVLWLGPNDEVLTWNGVADKKPSLASVACHFPKKARDTRIGATGFAWAGRREILERHGLYEKDVTGGGDVEIAAAFYGWFDHRVVVHGTNGMRQDIRDYVANVYKDVRGFVGYLPSSVSHLWHGSRRDRNYTERRDRLVELDFNPMADIEDDPVSRLLRWSDTCNPELKEYVKGYFSSRREDDADPVDIPAHLRSPGRSDPD